MEQNSWWYHIMPQVVGALITTVATVVITWFLFRERLGESKKKETREHRESLLKSTELLYGDVGSLMYKCQQYNFEDVMRHIQLMSERRHRGEYDMPLAPVIIQNEWCNILGMLENLRRTLPEVCAKDESLQKYLLMMVFYQLATVLQTNLNVIRQPTVKL